MYLKSLGGDSGIDVVVVDGTDVVVVDGTTVVVVDGTDVVVVDGTDVVVVDGTDVVVVDGTDVVVVDGATVVVVDGATVVVVVGALADGSATALISTGPTPPLMIAVSVQVVPLLLIKLSPEVPGAWLKSKLKPMPLLLGV